MSIHVRLLILVHGIVPSSRSQPHRVSWEERSFTNIVQAAEELDNTLEAKPCSSMCWGTILEGFDVVLDCLNGDAKRFSSFSQHDWVVDSLGSARDFFSAHEEVIRVCVVGVGRVNHSVERSRIDRVPIQHVKVSVVLISDQSAKSFLCLGRKILKRLLLNASFMQHSDSFLEVNPRDRV